MTRVVPDADFEFDAVPDVGVIASARVEIPTAPTSTSSPSAADDITLGTTFFSFSFFDFVDLEVSALSDEDHHGDQDQDQDSLSWFSIHLRWPARHHESRPLKLP